MEEIWVTIPGFPMYSISSEGRVRNDVRERIVQPSYTLQGEMKIGLVDDWGKQHTRSVKVLVAENFVLGRTDNCNTPIHLDGDQRNVRASNIVWRPRHFALRYRRQFEHIDDYYQYGPLVDRKTGQVYDNVVEVCLSRGFLFYEVLASLVNKTPVVPTWDMFDWWKG